MDRDDHIDVHSDVSKPLRPRRIEVINGVERRRKWADDTKISLVAEALAPGAVVSDVARRNDINPSQLFGWIKVFRDEAKALAAAPCESDRLAFVPTVIEAGPPIEHPPLSPPPEPAIIEILLGAATVKIRGAVDAKTLAAVLKALRVLQ
ncbi:MAG: transposase [Hyphomicrobiaceae bacterium]